MTKFRSRAKIFERTVSQCWYVVLKSRSQNTKSDAMPNT